MTLRQVKWSDIAGEWDVKIGARLVIMLRSLVCAKACWLGKANFPWRYRAINFGGQPARVLGPVDL